jgi:hypothetical protein
MLKKSVSLVLVTLSLGSLASCGSKVADKPVATIKPATSGAMTTTGTKPGAIVNKAGALAIVPAGVTIDTDLLVVKILIIKSLVSKLKMVLSANIRL